MRYFWNSTRLGRIPEWPNGADCKSAGLYLRWFESIFAHATTIINRGSSSVDRASAFQAEGREFEPRLPLFKGLSGKDGPFLIAGHSPTAIFGSIFRYNLYGYIHVYA